MRTLLAAAGFALLVPTIARADVLPPVKYWGQGDASYQYIQAIKQTAPLGVQYTGHTVKTRWIMPGARPDFSPNIGVYTGFSYPYRVNATNTVYLAGIFAICVYGEYWDGGNYYGSFSPNGWACGAVRNDFDNTSPAIVNVDHSNFVPVGPNDAIDLQVTLTTVDFGLHAFLVTWTDASTGQTASWQTSVTWDTAYSTVSNTEVVYAGAEFGGFNAQPNCGGLPPTIYFTTMTAEAGTEPGPQGPTYAQWPNPTTQFGLTGFQIGFSPQLQWCPSASITHRLSPLPDVFQVNL